MPVSAQTGPRRTGAQRSDRTLPRFWLMLLIPLLLAYGPVPAAAESLTSPILISVPSTTIGTVGSGNGRDESYFAFRATAGTAYSIYAHRELHSASFQLTLYTHDNARNFVASGQSSNTRPWITPALHSGNYLLVVDDGLVGYASSQPYLLELTAASTDGAPTGPVPGLLLLLSPATTTVKGGTTFSQQVTIAEPAPEGGTTVTLSSSSRAVGLPASVVIAAGQVSAVFPMTTTTVRKSQSSTITATVGDVSATATVILTR